MKLYHPCLPAVADYFDWDEGREAVLVTEFIQGCTLREYCNEQGLPLAASVLLSIAIQLGGVLDYLHRQTPPVIHRDLKPSNIMMETEERIKLIDFGIARSFRRGAAEDTQWLGTPGFAAPEQSGGAQTDARTDIFGLGALLYYLVSGQIYASGSIVSSSSVMLKQLPELAGLIAQMLAPNPEHRPASAAEVCGSLIAIQRSSMRLPGVHGCSFGPKQSGKKIVLASIGQGSGATFITLTLAKLLQERGNVCTAMEHPLHTPEWRTCLHLRDSRKRGGLESWQSR